MTLRIKSIFKMINTEVRKVLEPTWKYLHGDQPLSGQNTQKRHLVIVSHSPDASVVKFNDQMALSLIGAFVTASNTTRWKSLWGLLGIIHFIFTIVFITYRVLQYTAGPQLHFTEAP